MYNGWQKGGKPWTADGRLVPTQEEMGARNNDSGRPHRWIYRNYVLPLANALMKPRRVFILGSCTPNWRGSGPRGDYASKFPNATVVSMDISHRPQICPTWHGDAQDPPEKWTGYQQEDHESFDVVIYMGVIEHIWNNELAVRNVLSLLRHGGMFVMGGVCIYDHGVWATFWRITPCGILEMFRRCGLSDGKIITETDIGSFGIATKP